MKSHVPFPVPILCTFLVCLVTLTTFSSGVAAAEESNASAVDAVVGDYRLTSEITISVTSGGEKLLFTMTGQEPCPIETGDRDAYRVPALSATLTLGRDSSGTVVQLCLHRFGEHVSAPRIVTGDPREDRPKSGGDSRPDKPIPETLEDLVPRLMVAFHVPGVAIAGIQDQKIAWHREYGVRCADVPDTVNGDTLFEACSMTKPTFAYVVMQLVERGTLALDEPLVTYLDKPYLEDEPLHRRITARMVLSHTSGFPNWREGGWRKGGPLPVLFEPGTKFGYSGEGFLYLLRVVEHLTGEPAASYIKKALFGPLGMTLSSYVWEERYDALAAAGHDRKGHLKKGRRLFRRANAGYSLYTTPKEYATFLIEMMRHDRSARHSISLESVDAMLTRTSRATDRKPVNRGGTTGHGPVYWGLGWPIDTTASGDRVYHGGANGTGFRCYSEFARERGSGLVIMTNSLSGDRLWRKVVEIIGEP
jgi:CubicO group peptidase (beta-lactamase class C family)